MAGLYVHIPFCRRKCAYCDFYSTPDRQFETRYVDALIKELQMRENEIGQCFSTVYLGGGTPSVLSSKSLENLSRAVMRHSSPVEFTIEANPEDITSASIQFFKSLGINRVSIGVQSFDDKLLRYLGRSHNSSIAREALRVLADEHINYSVDLMFGLPYQSLESSASDVNELLCYRPPHFSAYALMLESGTRLYAKFISGKLTLPSDDLVDQMSNHLIASARNNGYDHYEISNYSLPGFRSRHNASYWDMTSYLGIGASAHSFDSEIRRYNPSSVKRYIEAIESGVTAFEVEEETAVNRFNDMVMVGLRTADGLALDKLAYKFPDMHADLVKKAARYINKGLLDLTEGRLSIPESRWLTSDAIIRELFAD